MDIPSAASNTSSRQWWRTTDRYFQAWRATNGNITAEAMNQRQ